MTEFRLLLSAGKSQPVGSYRMTILVRRLWGYSDSRMAPGLSVHIQHVRSRLDGTSRPGNHILALKRRGYKLVQTRLLVTDYPASGSLIGYGKCAFERGGPGGPLFARATSSGTDPRMPRVFERDSVKAGVVRSAAR
jgi:hypothetical protein